jgi:acetyltransferase-like isoleucine patch superfamily enzyme
MLTIVQAVCWLLPPSRLKNSILRRFGHAVHANSRIGPVLVAGVARFEIAENARIAPFNVFKGLSLARLGEGAWVASWNWISAAPEFQTVDRQAGTLDMHRGAKIGSRNYLDCSGTIVIREFGWVGGNRTFLQTHEPDLEHHRQTAGRIVIGHHSLVNSCCVLLKGAYLPDQSVLETNSTMLASSAADQRRGVYAGSPAKWTGETHGEWFERVSLVMDELVIDGPLGVDSDNPAVAG